MWAKRVSHSDGTAKGLSEDCIVGSFKVGALADLCRERGVDRLEIEHNGTRIALVLGAAPEIAPPPLPTRTDDEKKTDARRAHLKRILGREPTAHEMETLP